MERWMDGEFLQVHMISTLALHTCTHMVCQWMAFGLNQGDMRQISLHCWSRQKVWLSIKFTADSFPETFLPIHHTDI